MNIKEVWQMEELKQEQQLDSLDILKDIIEPINSKAVKTKDLAIQLNVSEKELKSHIKANGYVWKGSTYTKVTENKSPFDDLKGAKRIGCKVDDRATSEKVKVTYRIDKELYRLVKLQAIIEDIDNTEVVEKAIRSYISDKAKDMLKQI